MKRRNQDQSVTMREVFIVWRLEERRKLFSLLRNQRREIFDNLPRAEGVSSTGVAGAGKEPVAPAQLAAAFVQRGHLSMPHSRAVEAAVLKLRWQVVLDRLKDEPARTRGAVQAHRKRVIVTDIDQLLLERTNDSAPATNEFNRCALKMDRRSDGSQ